MANPLIPYHFILDRSRAELPSMVCLGRTVSSHRLLTLGDEDRAAHMYIAGITGTGKSKFLENLVIQDIVRRHPVAVIDPAKTLYRRMLEFVAHGIELAERRGEATRYEILPHYLFLDLDEENNPLRVNPLEPSPHESTEALVDDLLKVCERLFGSLEETRRLRNVLRTAFWIVVELNRLGEDQLRGDVRIAGVVEEVGFPLNLDAITLFLLMEDELRSQMVRCLPETAENRFARAYWLEFFPRFGASHGAERLESSLNILQYFVGDATVRRFFGTNVSTLSISDLLATGKSLFCALPLGRSAKGAQLVGAFIATKFQRAAYRRPVKHRQRPYSLIIDEFHEFADLEFAKAATTCRQFGLRLVNAHQTTLQQPFDTAEGRALLSTIRANAQTQVFFRMPRVDAEEVAKELFALTQRRFHFRYQEQQSSVSKARGRVSTVSFQQSRSVGRTQEFGESRTLARTSTLGLGEARGSSISKSLSAGITGSAAESLTRTVARSEAEGITLATSRSHGISIAVGRSFSQMRDHRTGFTFTEGEGRSLAVQRSSGWSLSRSEQEGRTESTGSSFTVTDTEQNSLVHQKNESTVYFRGGVGLHRGRRADGEGTALGEMESHAVASGDSYTEAVQQIRGLTRGSRGEHGKTRTESWHSDESRVESRGASRTAGKSRTTSSSHTEGMTRSSRRDRSRSRSESRGETMSEGWQQTLSDAFSQLQQFSRSYSEALQRTVSRTLSKGKSQQKGESRGSSTATSRTKTDSHGTHERLVFYSLEGEREVQVEHLQGLEDRHCVVAKRSLAAEEIETLAVPETFFAYVREPLPEILLAMQRERFGEEVVAPMDLRPSGEMSSSASESIEEIDDSLDPFW